jgi:opacity protein-like surface antigen
MQKFKKYIYTTLISSLFFSEVNANDIYFSINQGTVSSDDVKIMKYQSLSQLVGDSGTQLELRIGVSDINSDKNESIAFFYLWNNEEKNNETGLGIGAEWVVNPFENKDFGFVLGGQAGLGYQDVSGDKINISSNVNKLSYVLNRSNFTPTVAQFEDDTYLFDIALTLGTKYNITKNISFDLGYVYKYDVYQISYRNQDSSAVLNQLSCKQDNHMLKTGLNFKF